MTPEAFIEVFQSALKTVIIIVSAAVLPSLLIGLVVAIFQATTSINEQTLSFLPRLIIMLLALMFFGHWITEMLMTFFYSMVDQIPHIMT